MIWVAWRQQRAQVMLTLGLVLAIAVMLAVIRADVVSLLPDKATVSDKYNQFLQYFVLVMLTLPALLGMFAGAPLFAREIEQGTHIFGLTQSISRRRWLTIKMLVAGGPLAASMFLLGLVAAWALAPMSFVQSGRITYTMFETQGVTLGAYTLVAFAVGATAGLLLRNTIAAMAVTLVVYAALVLSVANGARPSYAEPSHFVTAVTDSSRLEPMESWVVGFGYLDAQGNEVQYAPADCNRPGATLEDCLVRQGVVSRYIDAHLPGQFWRFQLTELALFLTVSAGVFAVGLWVARRRLT